MNTPKLRFKEFSGDWEIKKLGSETEWGSGGTPSKQEQSYWYGDIPWISASSMRGFRYFDSDSKITNAGLSNGSRLAEKGCLLLLVRGSMLFKKIPVGITTKDVAFNQDVKSIKTKQSINNEFLLYWFLSSENTLINMVSGTGIGAGKLDTQDLLAMDLSFPSLPEQTKIANFLTAIDDKIAQLTQKGKLLTQYKKGVMQQIFSQELRFKDDNGLEFEDWEEKELKDIAEINPKTGSLPDEFVYIDLESVEKGNLLKETIILKYEAPSRAQRILKNDDVLFQMVRPYQMNNLFFNKIGDYVASTGYAQIRAYENSSFIYHILHLESFVTEVMNRCTGTSYPAINSTDLGTITVQIPSLPEQTKIANFLTALDDKINQNIAKMNAVKQYKQGLLQQMFV